MTTKETHSLTFRVQGSGYTIELDRFVGVVAGYTGRNLTSVQHHIDELAEIGIPPPPAVPMFYPMPTELFTTFGRHNSAGENLTSGEVEPVYIRHAGRYYLGIGSDHTDRDLETEDIPSAKVACPKPIGPMVIAIDDFDSFSLDDCVARCWVDDSLYQEGKLSNLRTPKDVLDRLINQIDIDSEDIVCLGGTLPLLDGTFRSGTNWRIRLDLPDEQYLEHTYGIGKG